MSYIFDGMDCWGYSGFWDEDSSDILKQIKKEISEEINKEEENKMEPKIRYRAFKVLQSTEGIDFLNPRKILSIVRKIVEEEYEEINTDELVITELLGKITSGTIEMTDGTFKVAFAFWSTKNELLKNTDERFTKYKRKDGRDLVKDRLNGSAYEYHLIQFALPGCYPNIAILKGLIISEAAVRNIVWMKDVSFEDIV